MNIREKYPLGAKVKWSQRGREELRPKRGIDSVGMVRGYGRDGVCLRIKWPDYVAVTSCHHSFVEAVSSAETEGVRNV